MLEQLTAITRLVASLADVDVSSLNLPEFVGSGETVGIISILGYFLWERTRECKQLRQENKMLIARVIKLKANLVAQKTEPTEKKDTKEG